jgi:hypothetical protein
LASNKPLEVLRKPPPAMPRYRLLALTTLLELLAVSSAALVSISELADALCNVYDGETFMLYDGRGYGLAEAIDGAGRYEYDGYNERVNLVADLFNSRFWDPSQVEKGNPPDPILLALRVQRDDAVLIAMQLWAVFFPDEQKTAADFIQLLAVYAPVGAAPTSLIVPTSSVVPTGPTGQAEQTEMTRSTAAQSPLQRQPAQEAEILATLLLLGFDPLAIPSPPRRGLPSPAKREVQRALGYTTDVMKKAWQRLRDDGRIKDAAR